MVRLGPKPRIDWKKVREEFLQSDEDLTTFANSRGISPGYFILKAKELKFLEERAKLRPLVSQEINKHAVARWVERWDMKTALLDDIDVKIADYIKNGVPVVTRDGHEFRRPPTPGDLLDLTFALEKGLRCHKLLRGEPTGEINSTNLTILLAKFVQAVEQEKISIPKLKEISQEVLANGADTGNDSESRE